MTLPGAGTTPPRADLRPPDLVPIPAITFGTARGGFGLPVLFRGTATPVPGPIGASTLLFLRAVHAPAIAAVALVLRRAGPAGLGRHLPRLGLWRWSGRTATACPDGRAR
jgi:hypothetical protein